MVEAADDAADPEAAIKNPVLMSEFQNFFINFLGKGSLITYLAGQTE